MRLAPRPAFEPIAPHPFGASDGTEPLGSGSAPLEMTATSRTRCCVDAAERALGDVVAGRYRLVRTIGRGGMGELFVAFDGRAGRNVVLKFVRSDRKNDATRAALDNEGRVLRRICDPYVVALHDVGCDGPDTFVALEHLHGRDLEAALAQRTCLPWREGAQLLARVARALVAVHAAGVVHGDLKPANVFLCDSQAGPAVKLIDFGISSTIDASASPDTDVAGVQGTIGYLAPERLVGDGPSPAGDLYALGVLAWVVCAGREPFVARTTTELLFSHAFQPAPRLGSAATVPAALDDLVHALLAKDPHARPTACDVVVALERLASAYGEDDDRPGAAVYQLKPKSREPDFAHLHFSASGASGARGASHHPFSAIGARV